jgi:hypothetical protein
VASPVTLLGVGLSTTAFLASAATSGNELMQLAYCYSSTIIDAQCMLHFIFIDSMSELNHHTLLLDQMVHVIK